MLGGGARGKIHPPIFYTARASLIRVHRKNSPGLGSVAVAVVGVPYHEVAPQLVLMAFLQRVVNGGGFIDREYGIGRSRIDLLLRWPYRGADSLRAWQREALELKVWRDKTKDPLPKGLAQLDGYLERIGLDTGVLVIFDRRDGAEDIETRTRFEQTVTPAGRTVTLLRA
jgi:hypothetical protein